MNESCVRLTECGLSVSVSLVRLELEYSTSVRGGFAGRALFGFSVKNNHSPMGSGVERGSWSPLNDAEGSDTAAPTRGL
jgi:hypothetical protein